MSENEQIPKAKLSLILDSKIEQYNTLTQEIINAENKLVEAKENRQTLYGEIKMLDELVNADNLIAPIELNQPEEEPKAEEE